MLPSVLVDNFTLVKSEKLEKEEVLHLYFEERSDIPEEFKHLKLHSKGFYPQATIQDFPLRGFQVFLHIKRRRWQDVVSGEVKTRTWDLVADGTRITKEFAAFLKEVYR